MDFAPADVVAGPGGRGRCRVGFALAGAPCAPYSRRPSGRGAGFVLLAGAYYTRRHKHLGLARPVGGIPALCADQCAPDPDGSVHICRAATRPALLQELVPGSGGAFRRAADRLAAHLLLCLRVVPALRSRITWRRSAVG